MATLTAWNFSATATTKASAVPGGRSECCSTRPAARLTSERVTETGRVDAVSRVAQEVGFSLGPGATEEHVADLCQERCGQQQWARDGLEQVDAMRG